MIILYHSLSEPRLYSGVLASIVGGVITYGYLDPIFSSINMPLATAALTMLALGAAAIGMCFGVLLPLVFPGACFGAIVAIFIVFFDPFFTIKYMAYVCPLLVGVGGVIGLR